MTCPKCGGECYDNAERIATGWRGPAFKCKDPGCGWVKWPARAAAKAATAREPKWTWTTLYRTYARCWKIADKVASETRSKVPFTNADLAAMCATLFIACRDGVQEPAPAATEAAPQPVAAGAEDTDLPF